MSRIETTKFFATADRKAGSVIVGADFKMVISSLPHLTINVKTHALPMIKNEKVEYTTTGGVKTKNDGYLQTLNDIPVTLMERDNLMTKLSIEEMLLSDDNEDLEVFFFTGRTIDKSLPWGSVKNASIFIEDNPEADAESTTAPANIQLMISGHYLPPQGATGLVDLSKGLLSGYL